MSSGALDAIGLKSTFSELLPSTSKGERGSYVHESAAQALVGQFIATDRVLPVRALAATSWTVGKPGVVLSPKVI